MSDPTADARIVELLVERHRLIDAYLAERTLADELAEALEDERCNFEQAAGFPVMSHPVVVKYNEARRDG